jgi:hypothetical protein
MSQGAIYQRLLALSDPANKAFQRKNAHVARAHRLEATLDIPMTPAERLSAIRQLLRMQEYGWVSTDNCLLIIGNILQGDWHAKKG